MAREKDRIAAMAPTPSAMQARNRRKPPSPRVARARAIVAASFQPLGLPLPFAVATRPPLGGGDGHDAAAIDGASSVMRPSATWITRSQRWAIAAS